MLKFQLFGESMDVGRITDKGDVGDFFGYDTVSGRKSAWLCAFRQYYPLGIGLGPGGHFLYQFHFTG